MISDIHKAFDLDSRFIRYGMNQTKYSRPVMPVKKRPFASGPMRPHHHMERASRIEGPSELTPPEVNTASMLKARL